MAKEEIILEGVAIRVKDFHGKSQAEFAEAMGSTYKHLWKDSENRDEIIAKAYGQINPAPKAEATAESVQDGAAMQDANEGKSGKGRGK
jgi:hypothetical protein